MKIVLDTNILVGACMGSPAAKRVLKACLQKKCTPLIGAALFAEYEDAIGRGDVFKRCRLNHAERQAVLDALMSVSRWVRVYYLWRPNLADEGDNHIIELAVAGGADYLITRNIKDFNRAQLIFSSPKILTPEAFLEEQTWFQ